MNKLILKNINSFFIQILLRIFDSKIFYRKLILILFDYLFIYISFEFLFYLIGYRNYLFFTYFAIIALPTYILTKQFKPLTRFLGSSSFYKIFLRNFFIGIFSAIFSDLLNSNLPGFKYCIIFISLVFIMQSTLRILIRDFIKILLSKKYSKKYELLKL